MSEDKEEKKPITVREVGTLPSQSRPPIPNVKAEPYIPAKKKKNQTYI